MDVTNLERVILLHNRSFALLKWVGHQMQRGSLDLSHVHKAMNAGEAAADWLCRNRDNLPKGVRPNDRELTAFANLFASYLRTSFEIGKKNMASPCGCYCSFCAYLCNSRYLKPRSLSKRAHQSAMDLKRIYLQEIALEVGGSGRSILDELIVPTHPLAKAVAMATYAKELIRRTEFATQGEGVYALWREFAWSNGHPDRHFQLTATVVEQSQRSVIAELKNRLAQQEGLVQ
jgi:hypothetical protein